MGWPNRANTVPIAGILDVFKPSQCQRSFYSDQIGIVEFKNLSEARNTRKEHDLLERESQEAERLTQEANIAKVFDTLSPAIGADVPSTLMTGTRSVKS